MMVRISSPSTLSTSTQKKKEITVAITNRGKISVRTLDLLEDHGRFYFEYGPEYKKIIIDDFE